MEWPACVLRLAHAITVAEGSNPKWNNPGDLTGADAGSFPTCGTVNKDGVLKFVNKEDGETALLIKVMRMLTGHSHVYRLNYTLDQVGYIYANKDPRWAINVAKTLGVTIQTTLAELDTPA